MERYEYMQILLKVFPQNIIDQYNLNEKETNGFIYLEIRRSVYGLPQSCRLANDYPNNKLAPEGYYKVTHTPGLQKKISHPVAFSLVIDNFGIKYVGKNTLTTSYGPWRKNLLSSKIWTSSYIVESPWNGEV